MPDPNPNPNPSPEPTIVPEPEPSGVVEVQGRKLVPLDALIAERERVRTATENKLRADFKSTEDKAALAEQLQADLAAVQPHLEYLRAHPEVMQRQEPKAPDISDEDAEKTARDYELFTPTGLDLARAKRIIAKQREETKRVATEAAQEAIKPYAESSFTSASRQNFVWAASQRAADGSPLVDPTHLAQLWSTFPAELAANPDVAKVILKAAIGEAVIAGRPAPAQALEPTLSEPSGGRGPEPYHISQLEQRMAKATGLSEKDWTASAKTFQPDRVNNLE